MSNDEKGYEQSVRAEFERLTGISYSEFFEEARGFISAHNKADYIPPELSLPPTSKSRLNPKDFAFGLLATYGLMSADMVGKKEAKRYNEGVMALFAFGLGAGYSPNGSKIEKEIPSENGGPASRVVIHVARKDEKFGFVARVDGEKPVMRYDIGDAVLSAAKNVIAIDNRAKAGAGANRSASPAGGAGATEPSNIAVGAEMGMRR